MKEVIERVELALREKGSEKSSDASEDIPSFLSMMAT